VNNAPDCQGLKLEDGVPGRRHRTSHQPVRPATTMQPRTNERRLQFMYKKSCNIYSKLLVFADTALRVSKVRPLGPSFGVLHQRRHKPRESGEVQQPLQTLLWDRQSVFVKYVLCTDISNVTCPSPSSKNAAPKSASQPARHLRQARGPHSPKMEAPSARGTASGAAALQSGTCSSHRPRAQLSVL